MRPPILGLHHVTATVAEAQADVDFASGALGLRLVKRTVNFDNHNVYHFYYGDETGRPSTLWTTFPYKGWGVPVGVHGAGQIVATSFSVPSDALAFWEARLRDQGVVQEGAGSRFDEEILAFRDPSGLKIELITADRDERTPWTQGGIKPDRAIRGLHSVTLLIRHPAKTVELMTDLLGFEQVNEDAGRIRMGINGAGAGRSIDIVAAPDAPAAANGLGTVHHVALRHCRSGPAAPAARRNRSSRLAGNRGTRPVLLHIDLFPRAGRSPVRGSHSGSRLHHRRRTSPPWQEPHACRPGRNPIVLRSSHDSTDYGADDLASG